MTSNTHTIDYNFAIGTSGFLIATSNSNTIGSIITTGGNVGIDTTKPTNTLSLGPVGSIDQDANTVSYGVNFDYYGYRKSGYAQKVEMNAFTGNIIFKC